MTTKTKYLVIALLLLVLVTTSVGLSTWNIHYQAVIGTIKHHDTSSMTHSFLDEYIYFGSTTNGNATANEDLCNYPIGFEVDDEGNLVLGTDSYQVNQEDVFTFTYQSGLSYTPTVFVPSATASKGDDDHPTALFLKDGKIDTNWGIEDVFGEISFEYQYRKVAMPFVADYKGNSDNYCEINAINYQENRISVYLTWKNGKGNHQGTNVLVDLVVNDDGTHTTTIEGVTEQIANKISVNYASGIVTIGVNGFSSYELNMTNQGWSTYVPDSVGVYQCRISAKLVDSESDNSIANKNASELTDSEKVALEALELINEKTENDVKYATQVTYAVLPAEVTQQNKNTSYTNGTKTLQANRIGTTRSTMPLAEDNTQTESTSEKDVSSFNITDDAGNTLAAGASFVYKGQSYGIKITANFQADNATIKINYAEEQYKDAQDIVSHNDIGLDHVHATFGFSSDPNYIVSDPAVYYTIIKQEVKLTGWIGLETTYNGEAQVVTPTLVNDHGEVKAKIEYSYNGDTSTTHTNAGIYTVKAELDDAVEGSGHSSNFFLVNHASNGNSTEKTDLTATFTINKAPLTVTAKNHEITYGDAFAHDGVTHSGWVIGTDNATNSLAGTLAIVSENKDDKIGYNQESADTRKVGDYTLIASGYEDVDDESGKPIYADDGKHNYTFTYVDGTLTVKQLVAKFDWSNLDPTYNGTAQKPVATVTNEPYDDDVSILVTGEETNANVKVDENGNMVKNGESFVLTAEYNAKADELTGAQAGNYTLEGASGITQDFVIKPMSISGATITLGAALTYNGDEQTRDFTTTITLAESNPTLAESTDYLVAGHKATNAFTYTLTITGQSNYYQTKTSDWEILKKDLTVTADNVAVIYGDEITYTATYDGFVAGEGVGNLAGEIAYNSGYVRYQNISNWDNTGNKGVYTIVASGYENTSANDGKHNYNISYTNGTLTVEKATITNISVVGYTGTYDGAQHDSATKSAVTVNNQTLSWTLGIDKVRNVADSATYNYTVTAPNHYDAKGTFTVEITPASVKVVVDDQEITYGDAAPKYTVTYTGLFGSDSLGTTASCDYTKGNDAGTYEITLSENTNDNYVISNDSKTTATLTVKKAPNSITSISIVGWTYGQTAKDPSATAQFGDTITFTYSADGTNFSNEVPTNAGTYTLKATVAETTNYESAEATTTFTIAKAVVTSPAENTTKFEYTTQEQTYALTESDLYTISNNKRTIAGSQTVTVSLIDKGNYQWDNGTSDDLTFTFTIAKATVGTPTIQSKEYNGELQTADVPVRNYYTVIENNGGTNIGTYNVKLRLVDSANTKWASTPNADITLSFSITKITTIISDLKLVGWTYGQYDQEANSPTATINHNTAITYTYSKDGVTYTSAVPSEPGPYYVKASVDETENYTADEEIKTFEISRIVVTKPAEDEEKYVYDGTEKTYSLQTSTLYTITSDGLTQINAGTYPITIALNDTVHYQWNDYSDTALVYNFVIEKASIANATITLGNADNLVYNASEHTVTITGVYVNGKALSSSDYTVETSLTQTNAGNHAVTIKGQGNYTGSATTTFTIAKLTISRPEANSTPFVYNGTEQTYTIVENVAYTITGNKQTNAGEHLVTVAFVSTNYQWNDGTTEAITFRFSIAKVKLTITVKDVTVNYGDPVPTYTVTYDGFVNGEDQSVLTGTLAFDCTYAQGTKVGTYCSIKASGLTSNNYNIAYVSGSVTIKQLVISLDETLLGYKYGDTGATEIITNARNNVNISYGSIGNVISITYTDGITTSSNSTISVGNTYRIDYKLLDTTNYTWATTNEDTCSCYYKYKTAKAGNTWYTIEDAIIEGTGRITFAGNNSGTETFITTSFTKIVDSNNLPYYGTFSFVIENREFVVPHADSLNLASNKWVEESQTVTSGNVYAAVIIPNGITLTFTGSSVLAVTATVGYGPNNQTTTTCNRGVLVNDGTITMKSGTALHCHGFIKSSLVYENDKIKLNTDGTPYTTGLIITEKNTTYKESMRLYDYPGGNSTTKVKNNAFPANAWVIHNNACTTQIHAGTLYQGYVMVVVNILITDLTVGEYATILAADSSGGNCLFYPKSTNDNSTYIIKRTRPANLWMDPNQGYVEEYKDSYMSLYTITGSNNIKGQRDSFEIHGDYNDSTLKITVNGETLQTSKTISAPVGYMDIVIKEGSSLTLSSSDYMFLPGSSLTVEKDATLTINSDVDVAFIDKSTMETWSTHANANNAFHLFCVDTSDSYAKVNGTVIVNGRIGGKIETIGSTGALILTDANNLTASYTTKIAAYGRGSDSGVTFYLAGTSKPLFGKIISDVTGESSVEEGFNKAQYKAYNSAWYTAGNYTLTYNMNYSGSAADTLSKAKGTAITAADLSKTPPTRTGYTFGGWYADALGTTAVNTQQLYYGDVTIYAKWTANTYTVNFNANGGTTTTTSKTVTFDAAYGDLPDETKVGRTGYTFAGWWTNASGGTEITKYTIVSITTGQTLYAHWTANKYTIKFNYNFGDNPTVEETLIDYNAAYSTVMPDPEVPDGYEFTGWWTKAEGGEQIKGSDIYLLTDDQILFAHWNKLNTYVLVTYLDENGEELAANVKTSIGAQYSYNYNVPGYIVTWEDTDGNASVPEDATLESSITVTATTTPITYTVQYNTEGGTAVTEYNATYDEGFALPSSTRTGYTLMWLVNGEEKTVGETVSNLTTQANSTVTIRADWTAISYNVIFNSNSSTDVTGITNNQTFTYDVAQALSTNGYVRTGYTFKGWATTADGSVVYEDGENVSNLTSTAGSTVTLYAVWEANQYTVTLNHLNGTDTTETITVTYGQSYSSLTEPTAPSGYTFAGWYLDSSFATAKPPTVTTASNHNLYAMYTRTITFNANDGSVNVSTYAHVYGTTVSISSVVTATRSGYSIKGYYDSATGGTAYTTITNTSPSTIYVQWEKTPYTITVKTSNASVSGVTNGQIAYYGDTITFTVTYSGDSDKSTTVTDANGNEVTTTGSYTFTMPASNVTINASSKQSCFAAGTLITMADGTLVPVEQLKPADFILSYDFETGTYVPTIVAEVTNHGEDYYEVVTLTFSDNSTIRIIASHGFFSVTEMRYLDITTTNYEDYIGHNFMAYDGNGNTIIKKLVSATVTTEIATSYSLTAAIYINAIADGLITITPPMTNWYNMFVVDDNLMWNEELMAADIAQYGLFTYEEVEHLIPYEIFVASNFKYFKVAFAKGLVTMDEIEAFVAWYNELIESGEIVLGDMSQYLPPRETTTADVAEATLPPQVVTGDEQQQDTVEESIE